MNVILFGATGMVGQGVLRECLLDDGVVSVLAIGRNSSGQTRDLTAPMSPSFAAINLALK